jgi:hypothetical protein
VDLVDVVRVVGCALGVLGTVIIMPQAWRVAGRQLSHPVGVNTARLRIAGVTTTTDPAKIAELEHQSALQKAEQASEANNQQAVVNGRVSRRLPSASS